MSINTLAAKTTHKTNRLSFTSQNSIPHSFPCQPYLILAYDKLLYKNPTRTLKVFNKNYFYFFLIYQHIYYQTYFQGNTNISINCERCGARYKNGAYVLAHAQSYSLHGCRRCRPLVVRHPGAVPSLSITHGKGITEGGWEGKKSDACVQCLYIVQCGEGCKC